MARKRKKGRSNDRPFDKFQFQLHPLFVFFGIWYAFKGELFLFLLSALVAVQHECAHAFSAYKLGYKLNKIVLMPYGAVIDGDMRGISLKDEIYVAFCGPFCNLVTAGFFFALWWLYPTMYAFTDTACYSSLAIALVNLLPAYPLDGGRILRCVLAQKFVKTCPEEKKAEEKAEKICKGVTLVFALLFFVAFVLQFFLGVPNFTLLAFCLFLCFGCIGNKKEQAMYAKIDFSDRNVLKKGVEIRRIAIPSTLPVKDALRFVAKGYYVVLEVYDENEAFLFEISQNELSALFLLSKTPYEEIVNLKKRADFNEKSIKNA